MTSLPMRRWSWQNKLAIRHAIWLNFLLPELKTISGVTNVKIAGPGFLNIEVEEELWTKEIANILTLAHPTAKVKLGLVNQ